MPFQPTVELRPDLVRDRQVGGFQAIPEVLGKLDPLFWT